MIEEKTMTIKDKISEVCASRADSLGITEHQREVLMHVVHEYENNKGKLDMYQKEIVRIVFYNDGFNASLEMKVNKFFADLNVYLDEHIENILDKI